MDLIHPHSKHDVADALREASATGSRVMIVGGRQHIDKGNPSEVDAELWTTQLDVRAVLDEQVVGLRRVLNLKVGDTLVLNATPDSLVELRAGPISLTRGRMGRRNHNIAVRVEAPLTPSAKTAIQGGTL